jgi:transmembrane 9 superfamily member 3
MNHYWYQMYMDELPMWGLFGELTSESDSDDEKASAYLYTHRKLTVTFNQDRIIRVNLASDNLQPIVKGRKYPFTFEIEWIETDEAFEDRFDHYLDTDFFEHQIHWFSIFNSFMMVLFLCGLVALILMRTLRNDYARYTLDEDGFDLDTVGEESGWKQIHGDVFRPPNRLPLLSALIGVGHQLFSMFVMVCLLAMARNVYRYVG